MNITSYFTLSNIGKTGLSPTITIVDVADDSIVISAQPMTELANAPGWYKYNFVAFDPGADYIFTSDAGTATIDERNPTTARGVTNITLSVWEYDRDA